MTCLFFSISVCLSQWWLSAGLPAIVQMPPVFPIPVSLAQAAACASNALVCMSGEYFSFKSPRKHFSSDYLPTFTSFLSQGTEHIVFSVQHLDFYLTVYLRDHSIRYFSSFFFNGYGSFYYVKYVEFIKCFSNVQMFSCFLIHVLLLCQ